MSIHESPKLLMQITDRQRGRALAINTAPEKAKKPQSRGEYGGFQIPLSPSTRPFYLEWSIQGMQSQDWGCKSVAGRTQPGFCQVQCSKKT
jgi:hypothetical protein